MIKTTGQPLLATRPLSGCDRPSAMPAAAVHVATQTPGRATLASSLGHSLFPRPPVLTLGAPGPAMHTAADHAATRTPGRATLASTFGHFH